MIIPFFFNQSTQAHELLGHRHKIKQQKKRRTKRTCPLLIDPIRACICHFVIGIYTYCGQTNTIAPHGKVSRLLYTAQIFYSLMSCEQAWFITDH